MKKLRYIICLIMIFGCLLSFSYNEVEAKTYVDDFENLYFEATPKITDSKKFICSVTWTTKQKIKYLDVTVILPNDFEQNPYQSGRDNCAGTFEIVEVNGAYVNKLEFEIYYYQLGNIKTVFDYSYEYVLDEDDDNINSFSYIFITGKWTEEKKSSSAIISGVVISIASALVTYIIIQNSQKTNREYDYDPREDDIVDGVTKDGDNNDE